MKEEMHVVKYVAELENSLKKLQKKLELAEKKFNKVKEIVSNELNWHYIEKETSIEKIDEQIKELER